MSYIYGAVEENPSVHSEELIAAEPAPKSSLGRTQGTDWLTRLQSDLESVLRAPTDQVDSLLADELETALAHCQNKEWAEMMVTSCVGVDERDFVVNIKGDQQSF